MIYTSLSKKKQDLQSFTIDSIDINRPNDKNTSVGIYSVDHRMGLLQKLGRNSQHGSPGSVLFRPMKVAFHAAHRGRFLQKQAVGKSQAPVINGGVEGGKPWENQGKTHRKWRFSWENHGKYGENVGKKHYNWRF